MHEIASLYFAAPAEGRRIAPRDELPDAGRAVDSWIASAMSLGRVLFIFAIHVA
jgi:hypothetical protein